MRRLKVDICVIGAGAGGLSVAAGAAQMGASVALIERAEMGGDCLNAGCVPSKSLLAIANAVAAPGLLGCSGMARQPVAVATRIPVAVIRDRLQRTAWIVAENGYQELVGEVQRDIATAAVQHSESRYPLFGPLNEEPAEDFLAAVEAAKSYIKAGDIFQANLSRQWSGLLAEHTMPGDLYRRLRSRRLTSD